jgi:hypothetical protein
MIDQFSLGAESGLPRVIFLATGFILRQRAAEEEARSGPRLEGKMGCIDRQMNKSPVGTESSCLSEGAQDQGSNII